MNGKLIIDPNPCHLYPWTGQCDAVYSGSHACTLPGGHEGACECSCGERAQHDQNQGRRGPKGGAMSYAFSEEEARLLTAFVCGEVDPDRFFEGGDYPRLWAEKVGITDLNGLLRKLARLPSYRKA